MPCPKYTPLESGETGPSPPEMYLMARSSRGVVMLSLLQMAVAVFTMLTAGSFIFSSITIVCAIIGISGAARRRTCLLIVHFVFSLVLYLLTLVFLIMLVLYCINCRWWVYLIGFLFIIIQAIGLRHSRTLIAFSKKFGPLRCSRGVCCRNNQQVSSTETQTQPAIEQQVTPIVTPVQIQEQPKQQQMAQPMYPVFPFNPQQPGAPLRYPLLHQPIPMFSMPQGAMQAMPQVNGGPNQVPMYPVIPFVYRQE